MKLPGYYSSGEFAHKAHITKKTLRYYDEHNISNRPMSLIREPGSIMIMILQSCNRFSFLSILVFRWMI